MINRLLLAGLISVASVGACADYMFEVDGNLSFGEITEDSDYGYEDEFDTEATDFSAKIFFGKVSSNDVPIREAGFLSKKSSVSLSRNKKAVDFDDYCCGNTEVSRTERRLTGRFVLPNPNIILGLSYVQGDIDLFGYENSDISGYSADVGFYISDNSALWLSYENVDLDFDYFSYRDLGESTIKATYKRVSQIGSSNHLSWSVEVERTEEFDLAYGDSDRNSIGGSVVWYLNPKLSFGAGLRLDSRDLRYYGDSADATGAVFTPRASYDINENIGFYVKVRSEVMIIEDDYYGEDTDISDLSTTIGITARF